MSSSKTRISALSRARDVMSRIADQIEHRGLTSHAQELRREADDLREALCAILREEGKSTPLDWVSIAKAAGRFGIRYPMNAALESFLYEISHPAPSTGASAVKAQITPFSSVVGQSVLLLDDDGAALAHLSISIPNPEKPYRETAEEVARIIELAINQPPSEEVKRLRVRLADLMLADAKRKAGR